MRRRKAASQSSSDSEDAGPIESDTEEEVVEGGESEGENESRSEEEAEPAPKTSHHKSQAPIKPQSSVPQEGSKSEDPALVPNVGRFFMHDDRGRGGGRRDKVGSGEERVWLHDKFEVQDKDGRRGKRREGGRGRGGSRVRNSPKTENTRQQQQQQQPPQQSHHQNQQQQQQQQQGGEHKTREEKIVRYSSYRSQQGEEAHAQDPPTRQRRYSAQREQTNEPKTRYQPKAAPKAEVPAAKPNNNQEPSKEGSFLPVHNFVNAAPFTPMGINYPLHQYLNQPPFAPQYVYPANYQFQYQYPSYMIPSMPMMNQPDIQYYPLPQSFAPAPAENVPAPAPQQPVKQAQSPKAPPKIQKYLNKKPEQRTQQWVPKPKSHAIPIEDEKTDSKPQAPQGVKEDQSAQ